MRNRGYGLIELDEPLPELPLDPPEPSTRGFKECVACGIKRHPSECHTYINGDTVCAEVDCLMDYIEMHLLRCGN